MTVFDMSQLRRDFLISASAAPVYRPDRAPKPPADFPCAIAIGAFDGVHRGHRELLTATVRDARERGIAAVAVTFDPDPDCVVTDHPAPKLMAVRDRMTALATSGVDAVFVIPFDEHIAAMDHEAFFRRVILPLFDVRSIHVGTDFRLGRGGASTVDVIRAWGAQAGIDVTGHELLRSGEQAITSTRIRSLIAAGDLDEAAAELGRRYFVHGVVEAGRGEGSKLGFPTANIRVPRYIQRPAAGVYAGFALDGTTAWPTAINVGIPPTFADKAGAAELEANFLGFEGDLYDEDICVLFCRRLREQQKFDSIPDLVSTVKANIDDVRSTLGDKQVNLGFDF